MIRSTRSALGACAAALLAAACGDTSSFTSPATPTVAPSAQLSISAAAASAAPTAALVSGLSATLCLDVAGGTASVGAIAVLNSCAPTAASQQFVLPAAGSAGEVRLGTLCLESAGLAGSEGDAIRLAGCSSGANQRWTRTAVSELRGLNNRCIDVNGALAVPGTRLVYWGCHGAANQKWTARATAVSAPPIVTVPPVTVPPVTLPPVALPAPTAALVSGLSPTLCFDVAGGSLKTGALGVLNSCATTAVSQQLTLPAANTVGQVHVGAFCLEPASAQGKVGDLIRLGACSGAPNQRWTLNAASELRGIGGLCVELMGGKAAPGTYLVYWSCHGAESQKWQRVITAPTALGAIELSRSTLSVVAGQSASLTAALSTGHSIGLLGALTWASSAPGVAAVSSTGTVTGVAAGTATIEVRGGGLTARAVVTVTAAPQTGVYHVPAAVVADCSVDVTAALHAWFATVPDHATLVFGRNACYNIDGGLIVTDRHGLTFEGNGATFQVFSRGGRDRANWRFRSGSNLTLRNMTARGANPKAGLDNAAYDTKVEGQHAYRIEATQGVLLERVQAYDVWGDFVEAEPDWRYAFPGQPARNVVVRGSRFERNGRMGIGLTHVDGFVLEDSHVGDVRWSAIDLELDHNSAIGHNITIQRNTFGRIMHSMFVSKGSGLSESVQNIVIRGNTMNEHLSTCVEPIAVTPPSIMRYWTGWTITDNVLRPRNRAVGIHLTRVREVEVRNNTIISGKVGGCAQAAAMRFDNSHVGTVSGNTLTGGYTATHLNDALSTRFTFSGNVIK